MGHVRGKEKGTVDLFSPAIGADALAPVNGAGNGGDVPLHDNTTTEFGTRNDDYGGLVAD